MIQLESREQLEQLLGGGGAETALEGMLAEHPDPTVRLLAQLWAQSRSAEVEADEASTASEEPPDAGEVHRLRRRLAELTAELEPLREVNDSLAIALGACHLCWGSDTDCDACGGEGSPGWELPDRPLFHHLVSPALMRLRRTRLAKAGPPRHLTEAARGAEPNHHPERREAWTD